MTLSKNKGEKMKTHKIFVAHNSMGVSNSWKVSVFETQKSALQFIDEWHVRHPDRPFSACKIIPKRLVGKFASNGQPPRPFSGEYYGIVGGENSDFLGFLGTVSVSSPGDPGVERLFS